MKVRRVIPAAHIFPELKTYRCNECGVSRTVEKVTELAAAPEGALASDLTQKAAQGN